MPRLVALALALATPFLCGAALDDHFDLGGGGGQGFPSAVSRLRFGQGFARGRYEVAPHLAFDGTLGIAIHERTDFHGHDDPPGLDVVTGQELTFLRAQLHWTGDEVDVRLGVLQARWDATTLWLPAWQVRLGPRRLQMVMDSGSGGFAGGLYEGNRMPQLGILGSGVGLQTDSRFWHDTRTEGEGSEDGTEVRVTARERLRSLEVGACMHRQRLRIFAQVDWRPGGALELSAVAGVGWELGLGPRRERQEGPPDEMRFRP